VNFSFIPLTYFSWLYLKKHTPGLDFHTSLYEQVVK